MNIYFVNKNIYIYILRYIVILHILHSHLRDQTLSIVEAHPIICIQGKGERGVEDSHASGEQIKIINMYVKQTQKYYKSSKQI